MRFETRYLANLANDLCQIGRVSGESQREKGREVRGTEAAFYKNSRSLLQRV